MAQGRLPLWCPYTYSGHPFQADVQAAIFYPLSLLTIAVSWLVSPAGFTFLALEWEAIVHFWLASVFTYFFARRLLRHRGAALVPAIVFTYGGYLTSYPSQQLAVLEVGIWLPLILLCVDVGLERLGSIRSLGPCARNAHKGLDYEVADADGGQQDIVSCRGGMARFWPMVLAGLVWGISLLAGHPQTSMYVFYTVLLYAIFSAWRYRVRWHTALAAFFTMQVIGFGLAAVHLIPGFEYMRLSVRATIDYDEVAGGFLRRDVIQLLLPGSVSAMSPLYVGILPLLLALLAPILRRTAQVIFWSGMAVLALLLSFGGNTFVYSLFYLVVPGFGIFRSQERAAFIFSFSLALLAGFGVRFLLRPLDKVDKRLFNGFTDAAGYLTLGSLLLVALSYYSWLTDGWSPDSPFGPGLTRSVLLTVVLALCWFIFYLRQRRRARSTLWLTLVVALIVFDLFTINWRNNLSDVQPEDHWQYSPLVLVPMQDEETPFRLHNEWRLPGNYGCVYDLEDISGASPLRIETYDEFLETVPIERVWEMLNVKYVITWRKTLAPPSELLYEEPKGEEMSYLHRLDRVGPRAYVAHTARVADDAEALALLSDPDFDPFTEAVVSEPLPFSLDQYIITEEPPRVEWVVREPNRLTLDVYTPADGLLVLSEVYYPGWQALVDGEPAVVFRAQHTLRALPLKAGEHHVEMRFRPVTFTVGAVISAVTLLLAVAWIAWGMARGEIRTGGELGETVTRRN